MQRNSKSRSFIVHIDKVKAYYGDPPAGWLNVGDESSTSTLSVLADESLNEEVPTSAVSDHAVEADLVTFDLNQEFRRRRPEVRRSNRCVLGLEHFVIRCVEPGQNSSTAESPSLS